MVKMARNLLRAPYRLISPSALTSFPRILTICIEMARAVRAASPPKGRAGNRTLPLLNALALIHKKRNMRRVRNFAHAINFQRTPTLALRGGWP